MNKKIIGPLSLKQEAELRYSQQQLWTISKLYPLTGCYNIPAAIELQGDIDIRAIHKAIKAIVSSQDALNIIIDSSKEKPKQLVRKNQSIKYLEEKYIEEDNLEQALLIESKRPFILKKNKQLFRFILWKVTDSKVVLQLTIHHIIADRRSLSIIFEQFYFWYKSFLNGNNIDDSIFTISSFFEFIDKENKINCDQSLQYWKQKLSRIEYIEYIQPDLPNRHNKTFDGDIVNRLVCNEHYQIIQNICRKQKTRPFIFLLSVFYILLYRYSGSTDVVAATPFTKRDMEYENTIGMFVNTILLRVQLEETDSFVEVLTKIQKCVNEAIIHSDVPTEKAITRTHIKELAGHEIFQCMCIFESHDMDSIEDEQLKMRLFLVNSHQSKFPLSLYIYDTGSQFQLKIEYNVNMFSNTFIKQLLKHFCNMIESFTSSINFQISDVSYISEDDIKLLDKWNNTLTFLEKPYFLHKFIEVNTAMNPHSNAVIFQDRELSYLQLNNNANYLAQLLINKGVKIGDIVAVYSDKSIELIIAILAIMKIGAVYLPLDKSYPIKRIMRILSSAQPIFILTEDLQNDDGIILFKNYEVMNVSEVLKENTFNLATENPNVDLSEDNPSYIIYTSGSTGEPKGVIVSHLAIYNRISWMKKQYEVNESDIILHKTSIMFDVSVWEIMLPLFCGSTLVLSKPKGNRDAFYLRDLILRHKITMLHFVPIMLEAFLAVDLLEECSTLKHIICSGESLNSSVVKKFYEIFPNTKLHNLYGPTEAAVDVTYYYCSLDTYGLIPIGRPIWNTKIYILDNKLKLLPPNVIGELFISGVCLANGYLGKADLTAEKFINNPFLTEQRDNPYKRLYSTGDLAKWTNDGNIIFLGRKDRQIKVRGVRIEASEIEAVLNSYENIKSSYVCKKYDNNSQEQLVAYIQLKVDTKLLENQLKTYLLKELPEYVIPTYFVSISEFPTTASGKVDVNQLPIPKEVHATYREPSTHFEKTLVNIFEKVLEIKKIGIDDHFFGLGGDSIKSIQVIVLARKSGIKLNTEDLLRYQTVALLSCLHKETDFIKNSTKILPFQLIIKKDKGLLPSNVEDAYPMSNLQLALIYHSESSSEYNVYVTTYRIKAIFDYNVLKKAIKYVSIIHPILRTYFDVGSYSKPMQIIKDQVSFDISVEDIKYIKDQKKFINLWLEKEKANGFDWEEAPLFRFKVHICNKSEFQFTMSEPCLDGWSVSLLVTDIFKVYLKLLKKEDLLLPMLKINSAYFIQNEQKSINSKYYKNFWKQQLSKIKETIVFDKKLSEVKNQSLQRITKEYDSELSESLKIYAKKFNFPIKTMLLAIHCLAVSQYLGQDIITTGVMSNCRPELEDGEKVVGLFLNVLPITVDCGTNDIYSLLKKLIDIEHEILKYRFFPYSEMFRGKPDFPFDTLFNFTNFYPYQEFVHNKHFQIIDIIGTDQTLFNLTAQFTILQTTNNIRLALDFNHFSSEKIIDCYVNSATRLNEFLSEERFIQRC